MAVGDDAADAEDEEAGRGNGHVLPMHGAPGGCRGSSAGPAAQGLRRLGTQGADVFAHVRRALHGERVVGVVGREVVVVVVAVVAVPVAVFFEVLLLAGDGDELFVVGVRLVELLLDVVVDALHGLVVLVQL